MQNKTTADIIAKLDQAQFEEAFPHLAHGQFGTHRRFCTTKDNLDMAKELSHNVKLRNPDVPLPFMNTEWAKTMRNSKAILPHSHYDIATYLIKNLTSFIMPRNEWHLEGIIDEELKDIFNSFSDLIFEAKPELCNKMFREEASTYDHQELIEYGPLLRFETAIEIIDWTAPEIYETFLYYDEMAADYAYFSTSRASYDMFYPDFDAEYRNESKTLFGQETEFELEEPIPTPTHTSIFPRFYLTLMYFSGNSIYINSILELVNRLLSIAIATGKLALRSFDQFIIAALLTLPSMNPMNNQSNLSAYIHQYDFLDDMDRTIRDYWPLKRKREEKIIGSVFGDDEDDDTDPYLAQLWLTILPFHLAELSPNHIAPITALSEILTTRVNRGVLIKFIKQNYPPEIKPRTQDLLIAFLKNVAISTIPPDDNRSEPQLTVTTIINTITPIFNSMVRLGPILATWTFLATSDVINPTFIEKKTDIHAIWNRDFVKKVFYDYKDPLIISRLLNLTSPFTWFPQPLFNMQFRFIQPTSHFPSGPPINTITNPGGLFLTAIESLNTTAIEQMMDRSPLVFKKFEDIDPNNYHLRWDTAFFWAWIMNHFFALRFTLLRQLLSDPRQRSAVEFHVKQPEQRMLESEKIRDYLIETLPDAKAGNAIYHLALELSPHLLGGGINLFQATTLFMSHFNGFTNTPISEPSSKGNKIGNSSSSGSTNQKGGKGNEPQLLSQPPQIFAQPINITHSIRDIVTPIISIYTADPTTSVILTNDDFKAQIQDLWVAMGVASKAATAEIKLLPVKEIIYLATQAVTMTTRPGPNKSKTMDKLHQDWFGIRDFVQFGLAGWNDQPPHQQSPPRPNEINTLLLKAITTGINKCEQLFAERFRALEKEEASEARGNGETDVVGAGKGKVVGKKGK